MVVVSLSLRKTTYRPLQVAIRLTCYLSRDFDHSHGSSLLGHINHSLFWTNLAPSAAQGKGNGGVLKAGPLKSAIESTWGSLEALKQEFNATTAAIQGSGWGWLVRVSSTLVTDFEHYLASVQGYNTKSKTLEIVTTANQDPLLSHVPIVGVDIWEHAFYLQYLNVKVDVSISATDHCI